MVYSNNFLFLAKYQYTKMSIVSKVDRMAKTQSFNIIHKLQKKREKKNYLSSPLYVHFVAKQTYQRSLVKI